MSDSQFENVNPYSAQSAAQPLGNESTTQFTILGIVFLVLAALSICGSLFMLLGAIIQVANGQVVPPPNSKEAERVGFYIGYWGFIGTAALSGFLHLFVAWAGINMLRRTGIGMAKVGAIILCIPCLSSCFLLGMPFGIWAMVALSGVAAKQAFRG